MKAMTPFSFIHGPSILSGPGSTVDLAAKLPPGHVLFVTDVDGMRFGLTSPMIEALRSAIAGAVDAGASNTELRALLLLGSHHLDNADFAEADAVFTQATSRAKAEGTPWVPYAAEARWMHAVSLRMQGRWDEALGVLDTSMEVVPPIYDAVLSSTRAQISSSSSRGAVAPLSSVSPSATSSAARDRSARPNRAACETSRSAWSSGASTRPDAVATTAAALEPATTTGAGASPDAVATTAVTET